MWEVEILGLMTAAPTGVKDLEDGGTGELHAAARLRPVRSPGAVQCCGER